MKPHFTELNPDSPRYRKYVEINKDITTRSFHRLILSRLYVLEAFLKVCRENRHSYKGLDKAYHLYKHKWLLLQLLPSETGVGDYFHMLENTLRELCSEALSIAILDKYKAVSILLHGEPIFVVLDEAQATAERYSSKVHSDTGYEKRGIAKPMIASWTDPVQFPCIISGTGLSMSLMEKALGTTVAKREISMVSFDTGYFDSEALHTRYIKEHVWPNSELQEVQLIFLARTWRWLRGRHVLSLYSKVYSLNIIHRYRFTTSFVQLLRAHPTSPHRLLDAFIRRLTSRGTATFLPTDGAIFAEHEPQLTTAALTDIESIPPLNFSALNKQENFSLRSTVQKVVMNLALRSRRQIVGADVLKIITLGLGRISRKPASVVDVLEGTISLDLLMDEPLVLCAGLMYFKNCDEGMGMGLEYSIYQNIGDIRSPSRGFAFENLTALILANRLNGKNNLEDIFTIHYRGKFPARLLKGKVKLVSILGWDHNKPVTCDAGLYFGASPILGFEAETPDGVMHWNESGIPILFPDVNAGPDICALSRIGDNSYAWILMQDKMLRRLYLTLAQTMHSLKTTTPNLMYTNKVSSSSVVTVSMH
jgi:hypothetical protein